MIFAYLLTYTLHGEIKRKTFQVSLASSTGVLTHVLFTDVDRLWLQFCHMYVYSCMRGELRRNTTENRVWFQCLTWRMPYGAAAAAACANISPVLLNIEWQRRRCAVYSSTHSHTRPEHPWNVTASLLTSAERSQPLGYSIISATHAYPQRICPDNEVNTKEWWPDYVIIRLPA